MDEHRFVDAGLSPARESQGLDAGHTDVAEFEIAIIRGKRDRRPAIARGSAAH